MHELNKKLSRGEKYFISHLNSWLDYVCCLYLQSWWSTWGCRWDSRSPSPRMEEYRPRKRGGLQSPTKHTGLLCKSIVMVEPYFLGGYNEYVNYSWDDYDKEGGYSRPKPRLTRATSSRDSGSENFQNIGVAIITSFRYYGGIATMSRDDEMRQARRRERGERDQMVRDYIR